jgi:hypothetical protein
MNINLPTQISETISSIMSSNDKKDEQQFTVSWLALLSPSKPCLTQRRPSPLGDSLLILVGAYRFIHRSSPTPP